MAPYITNWRRPWCAAAIWLLGAVQASVAQLPDFGAFGRVPRGETATVKAEFTPASADRPALVFVTAKIADGYHMSAVDQGTLPDGGGPQATIITITQAAEVRQLGPFQPLQAPKTHVDDIVWKGLELREHESEVTWVAPVEIAEGADVGSLVITGRLEGQACDQICVLIEAEFQARAGDGSPLPSDFTLVTQAEVPTADARAEERGAVDAVRGAPRASFAADRTDSATVAATTDPFGSTYDVSQIHLPKQASGSLFYYLATAFLGGLILNVMPCVLPVIGLKVMSFVEQAGESRRRALVLNVWYSAGIIAVFLALAALAVTLQIGWGDQFGNSWFLITLTAIVFAMALSMLGLWEIPIPGFVSSGAVLDAAHREGATAAFLKGVLTTILATPCTGPYMVSGVAWAVEQPPHVTFSVFAALGIGMASPYLLVGAFPSLIRFLPRPGMWMETFKKIMGLGLLATVAWLLSTLDPPLVAPTFVLMVGITAACWWIARVPLTEPRGERIRAWGEAIALTAAVTAVAFGWFYPSVMLPRFERRLDDYAQKQIAENQLEIAARLSGVSDGAGLAEVLDDLVANVAYDGDQPWQSFTLPKLARLTLDEGRTVLVDFTADWCASCKYFEQTVLKTDDVTRALDDAGVLTMSADYTKKPAWMSRMIRALGGIGVPVVAIFPADKPYHPIVFTGGYTKSSLLDAIAKATGGRTGTKTASRGGDGGR